MQTQRIIRTALALVLLCLFSSTAFGDQGSNSYLKYPESRFHFSLGGYAAFLDSSVQLGLQGVGLGISVDTETFLGLDSTSTVLATWFEAALGKSRRHNLAFSYWSFERSGFVQVTQDTTIGDINLPIGSTLETKLDFSLFRAKYLYSVVKADRVDVQIGPGIFIMPIEFETRINAPGLGVDENNKFDITAPLPVVGLHLKVALTPRLYLYQKLDLMYLSIGEFSGSIIDGDLGLEYQITKHLGIGGGWHVFDLKIDAQDDSYPGIDPVGRVDFFYSGLLLFASAYF